MSSFLERLQSRLNQNNLDSQEKYRRLLEKSEQQEREGKVFTQKEVEKKAKKWLK